MFRLTPSWSRKGPVDRQARGSPSPSSYFPGHQDHPTHPHKLLSQLTLKLRYLFVFDPDFLLLVFVFTPGLLVLVFILLFAPICLFWNLSVCVRSGLVLIRFNSLICIIHEFHWATAVLHMWTLAIMSTQTYYSKAIRIINNSGVNICPKNQTKCF